MSDEPLLTTLGLFIIDENRYPLSSGRATEVDIIGGGASYAIVGGRIAAGERLGSRICGIVDKGSDFPEAVQQTLEDLGTGIVFRDTPDRLTTRGANVYTEDGAREFIYLAPKKRIVAEDILADQHLLSLRSFHFCCSLERCEEAIDLFAQHRGHRKKAKVIFEPFPGICNPENAAALFKMLHKVEIFSPNLMEAAAFLLRLIPTTEKEIANLAAKFYPFCPKDGGVVLRCGELGCFIKSANVSVMLPAYHQDQTKVVDVTGGGNSFCGAFVAALELSGDWLLAGVLASVASGIVIEQLGLPSVVGDVWNGLSIHDRLAKYCTWHKEIVGDFDQSLQWMGSGTEA